MRLGGVDPSILRELSGVYKPFVKAFKELVSNAFDADAQRVEVIFASDFASVTVRDDGAGMTPFEFRNDFTRIGGGSRRWSGGLTRGGRPRIGSKGIGFLALARYCDRLHVESSADRDFIQTVKLDDPSRSIGLWDLAGISLPSGLAADRLECTINRAFGKQVRLKEGKEFRFDPKSGRVSFPLKPGPIELRIRVNCSGLHFRASLDFHRLLKLADAADLEHLDDFATIELSVPNPPTPGTHITADGLKNFVRRELKVGRRQGFIRNVGSWGGLEQFVWNLSRCTPIAYRESETGSRVAQLVGGLPPVATLPTLIVRHDKAESDLRRPIFPQEKGASPLHSDMHIPVSIEEDGLSVRGFLAGYENVIFPAEYRGISIRVRGVAIGESGFFGAEHLLTGANKAALSQITGELIVSGGLDAVDTLNPGRESFYEESEQFKTLRRHLIGEGEQVRGYIGRAIEAVLRRSQVRSALADVLGRASVRRRALEDISAAVTHLLHRKDDTATALRQMLKSKASHVNGLASAADHELGTPPRIGGLSVVAAKHLAESAVVNFTAAQVQVDTARPEWSWRLLLHDRPFDVLHKRSKPDDALAEMDAKSGRIYVNWGHSIKQQMDERSFLRFALSWILAKEAACRDPGQMMDLALGLLSFTIESNA